MGKFVGFSFFNSGCFFSAHLSCSWKVLLAESDLTQSGFSEQLTARVVVGHPT